MATKYAVYDPTTGENTLVDNKEDAILLFWQRMIEFAKPYFHDTAYMTIKINDETGAETWYNDVNDEINRPKTSAEIQAIREKTMARNQGLPQTLPTSYLGE